MIGRGRKPYTADHTTPGLWLCEMVSYCGVVYCASGKEDVN